MNKQEPMDVIQLAERLNALALWCTPGAPRSALHYPAGEAEWLRQAARRLLELQGDIEVMDALHVAKGPHWKHWAALNKDGDIVTAASSGMRLLSEHIADVLRPQHPDAGDWVLRPIIFGRSI